MKGEFVLNKFFCARISVALKKAHLQQREKNVLAVAQTLAEEQFELGNRHLASYVKKLAIRKINLKKLSSASSADISFALKSFAQLQSSWENERKRSLEEWFSEKKKFEGTVESLSLRAVQEELEILFRWIAKHYYELSLKVADGVNKEILGAAVKRVKALR